MMLPIYAGTAPPVDTDSLRPDGRPGHGSSFKLRSMLDFISSFIFRRGDPPMQKIIGVTDQGEERVIKDRAGAEGLVPEKNDD